MILPRERPRAGQGGRRRTKGAPAPRRGFAGLFSRRTPLRRPLLSLGRLRRFRTVGGLASVLIGERRWNLRLKNGVNVRLPEAGVARALDQLAALDREKNLLARDISLVDLRLPDRVTLRLSESVAQAREEALKAKRSKPKGGSA